MVRTDCTKKPMPAHGRVLAGRRRAMNAADRVIRLSTELAVVGVAAVPAVVSYKHASALVRRTASRAGLGALSL